MLFLLRLLIAILFGGGDCPPPHDG